MNPPASEAGARSFLGRARELDDLAAALAEARAGRGRLYLVRGEAGIGKTSLAEELSSRAVAADVGVYWGRCWDGESAPPYWPWVQLLRALARAGSAAVLQPSPEIAGDLARLLPELSTHAGSDAEVGEQERFRLFRSVTHVLRQAAAVRPALLVLDDLQAADTESLLLLGFLARELRSAAILVVGTYRDGDAGRSGNLRGLLADVAREARNIPLAGLGPSELQSFARQRTGVALDDDLLAELQRITDGNPFFLEEVLQLLFDEQRLTAPRPSDGLRVPESVRDVVRRRLEVLPAATNELLAAAAVLGHELDAAVLEKVADLPPGAAADLLVPAIEAGIVRAAGTARYAFSRGLVRETLYEGLPFPRRVELHRRAGAALLAGDPEESVDELAHHFLRAAAGGDVETAVLWATRAGDRAMQRLAYEAAAAVFARALTVMREAQTLPGATEEWQRRRIEILTRLGNAHARAGDGAAADEAFVDAVSRARAIGDGPLMASAALGLGQVRFERGRTDVALLQWLEEALALLGPQSSALRARVMARLTESSFLARLEPGRVDLTQQAIETARASGDRAALADALNARHNMLWQPDSTRERLLLADEIIRLADEAGEQPRALSGLGWRIYALLELGETTAVDVTIAEYERRAEGLRLLRHRWFANVFRTGQALLRGAFDEAERLLAKGIQVRQTTDASPSQFHAGQMFFLRREQGRLGEVEAALRAVLQLYPAVTSWICTLALLQVEVGEIGEARALFARLAAHGFEDLNVDATWLTSMSLLAEVCASLRDRAAASLLYPLLLPYRAHNIVIVGGVGCRGAVPYFLGQLATTLERWEVAADHFQEACARHARIGALPLLAHAQHGRAEALSHCGRGDEAAPLRASVLATARDFGLVRLLGQARPSPAEAAAAPPSFRRDGDHWVVLFAGNVIRLRNSRGCEYLAHLLARPGERVAALELQSARPGAPTAAGEEQARIAVRKAIHVVLRAIEGEHLALHAHLADSLRTGRWCLYAPDPPLGAPWEIGV